MNSGKNHNKAFVCGWPIAHSRSPLIHTYWLNKYNLDGVYEKIAIAPDQLTDFLTCIKEKGYCGGNFTIPHKEKVCGILNGIDIAAKQIGAINTVWFEDNELVGTNTDWKGFALNMDHEAYGWDNPDRLNKPAIVLGAGGAARGILYALQKRGFSNVYLVNRTLEKAQKIARDFGGNIKAVSWEAIPALPSDIAILINTTSLGMSGKNSLSKDLVAYVRHLAKDAIVSDIVYIPLKTELLALAAQCELKTVDGLGMLLHQAAPGFEHWFGVKPEVTRELRDLILQDIGQQA